MCLRPVHEEGALGGGDYTRVFGFGFSSVAVAADDDDLLERVRCSSASLLFDRRTAKLRSFSFSFFRFRVVSSFLISSTIFAFRKISRYLSRRRARPWAGISRRGSTKAKYR